MLRKKLSITTVAGSLLLAAGLVQAADQVQDQTQDQTQDRTRLLDQTQDQIYGSQLMTEQERVQYRAQLRSFKTEKEREMYRLEHHKRMQLRAKEKGVTLPVEPPMKPGGTGYGAGGAGPGGKK